MYKSLSVPYKLSDKQYPLRSSSSLEKLDEVDNSFIYEDKFEGDGPFGIEFYCDKNSNILIKKILDNTAFNEYYKLKTSLRLIEVNGISIIDDKYENVVDNIKKYWNDNCEITLKFKKNIIKEISDILNKYDLYKYYDQFIELGTKIISDFEYVIYEDLINMNMNDKEIERFKNINPNIY
jgi:hypothetical protein